MMHTDANNKTVIVFDSSKYKHDFEFIRCKSKNIVVCCAVCAEAMILSTVTLYFINLF